MRNSVNSGKSLNDFSDVEVAKPRKRRDTGDSIDLEMGLGYDGDDDEEEDNTLLFGVIIAAVVCCFVLLWWFFLVGGTPPAKPQKVNKPKVVKPVKKAKKDDKEEPEKAASEEDDKEKGWFDTIKDKTMENKATIGKVVGGAAALGGTYWAYKKWRGPDLKGAAKGIHSGANMLGLGLSRHQSQKIGGVANSWFGLSTLFSKLGMWIGSAIAPALNWIIPGTEYDFNTEKTQKMLGASVMAGVMLHPYSFGFFDRKVRMWTGADLDSDDWKDLAAYQKGIYYVVYPIFRVIAFPLQCTNWFTGKIWGNVSDATNVPVPDTIWITSSDWKQGWAFLNAHEGLRGLKTSEAGNEDKRPEADPKDGIKVDAAKWTMSHAEKTFYDWTQDKTEQGDELDPDTEAKFRIVKSTPAFKDWFKITPTNRFYKKGRVWDFKGQLSRDVLKQLKGAKSKPSSTS